MQPGNTTVVQGTGPRSDDSFQKLLLDISDAAARGTDASSLLQLFCRATREFFKVSGTYFWRLASSEELVGAEADGLMAEHFRGARLKAGESAVAMEAVRSRRTVYVNHLDPLRYRMAGEFHARSIMAAPLVVANEIIGTAVFLHDSDPRFFNDDLAAKATILAGQLGSLLEATRLTQASRDGGVDCVAWDMRPIVGGKVIVQAKRYKHTVGVSAVRDLYGTVMNEGGTIRSGNIQIK